MKIVKKCALPNNGVGMRLTWEEIQSSYPFSSCVFFTDPVVNRGKLVSALIVDYGEDEGAGVKKIDNWTESDKSIWYLHIEPYMLNRFKDWQVFGKPYTFDNGLDNNGIGMTMTLGDIDLLYKDCYVILTDYTRDSDDSDKSKGVIAAVVSNDEECAQCTQDFMSSGKQILVVPVFNDGYDILI